MNILKLANSIGWPVEFIALERGIVLRPSGDSWVTHSGSPVQVAINEVTKRWRPVLIRCRMEPGDPPLDVMLHPEGGFAPGVPYANLPMSRGLFFDNLALCYLADALTHHVVGMVAAYEQVRNDFKRMTLIPGFTYAPRGLYGGNPKPYFEFDALLGVARRGYDTCRYLLWKCFGPEKGTMPRSFEKVLPRCDRLSVPIRENLQKSWLEWGTLLKSYRDCIHHYVPLDFGQSSIDMQEGLSGVWIAWARIPDNPNAQSKSAFKFVGDLDALTFGWSIAVEVTRVLGIVSRAVIEQQKAAKGQE